jgi:hypothetical protein
MAHGVVLAGMYPPALNDRPVASASVLATGTYVAT